MPLAMLDFGESRCEALDADFEKCDNRFPPYVDLEDVRAGSLSDPFVSGVNGEELFCEIVVRARGDGVKGIRPPAVRVEKSPAWDLIGVDTAVAISQYRVVISVERQVNVSIDGKEVRYIERAPRDST